MPTIARRPAAQQQRQRLEARRLRAAELFAAGARQAEVARQLGADADQRHFVLGPAADVLARPGAAGPDDADGTGPVDDVEVGRQPRPAALGAGDRERGAAGLAADLDREHRLLRPGDDPRDVEVPGLLVCLARGHLAAQLVDPVVQQRDGLPVAGGVLADRAHFGGEVVQPDTQDRSRDDADDQGDAPSPAAMVGWSVAVASRTHPPRVSHAVHQVADPRTAGRCSSGSTCR